jgi:hypothetical protein
MTARWDAEDQFGTQTRREKRMATARLLAVLHPDVDAASCIDWIDDEIRLIRWDEVHGLRPTERRTGRRLTVSRCEIAQSRPGLHAEQGGQIPCTRTT